jgi:hypothetical protein
LDDRRLRQGHNHYVGQVEIGVLALRVGPGRKGPNNIVAEQHHQVVAFGEDHQARRRSDLADNVGYRVCVASERSNTRQQLRDNWPDERVRRCWDDRILGVAIVGCAVRVPKATATNDPLTTERRLIWSSSRREQVWNAGVSRM